MPQPFFILLTLIKLFQIWFCKNNYHHIINLHA